jgi:hypothetical protein
MLLLPSLATRTAGRGIERGGPSRFLPHSQAILLQDGKPTTSLCRELTQEYIAKLRQRPAAK